MVKKLSEGFCREVAQCIDLINCWELSATQCAYTYDYHQFCLPETVHLCNGLTWPSIGLLRNLSFVNDVDLDQHEKLIPHSISAPSECQSDQPAVKCIIISCCVHIDYCQPSMLNSSQRRSAPETMLRGADKGFLYI